MHSQDSQIYERRPIWRHRARDGVALHVEILQGGDTAPFSRQGICDAVAVELPAHVAQPPDRDDAVLAGMPLKKIWYS